MKPPAPGRALRSYCLIRDALIADYTLRRLPALRELLMTVAWEWSQGRALTIKHCILTYPGAEKIVRKNIRMLLDAGYVEVSRSDRDRRERLLKPSPMTLDRLRRIDELLDQQDRGEQPLYEVRDRGGIAYATPAYMTPISQDLDT